MIDWAARARELHNVFNNTTHPEWSGCAQQKENNMTTEQYQIGYEEGYQEGWKLVTVEPTQEMLNSPPNAWPADAKVVWAAMLAASPTPPAEQAAPKAALGEPYKEELARLVSTVDAGSSADYRALQEHIVMRAARAVLSAAPQQEAQEPALFVSAKQLADLADPSHATAGSYLPARKTRAGRFTLALYTTPQPAPAPLSDDVLKKAARYDFLRDCDLDYMAEMYWPGGQVPTGDELDAAIDAARARLEST